jgi:hypothetical protein
MCGYLTQQHHMPAPDEGAQVFVHALKHHQQLVLVAKHVQQLYDIRAAPLALKLTQQLYLAQCRAADAFVHARFNFFQGNSAACTHRSSIIYHL